jgi:putative FmdB family regulatory protein
MPLYEYECDGCGGRFELIRKFSDPSVELCELCGKGPVRRLQSAPAIQFKGSGFYITDYARQGQDGDKGKSDKAATDKSTDAKPEAAAADKSAASEAKAETASSNGTAKSDPPKAATSAPAPSAPTAKD